MEALRGKIVGVIASLPRLTGPANQRRSRTVADLLRLRIQQLLRRLFPGKTKIAHHGDQPQADTSTRREKKWPLVSVVPLAAQQLIRRLVSEVAGGNDVRDSRA